MGNVTTYVVTGLNPGTVYYYRVRANNMCGTSANSGFSAALTSSVTATPSSLSGTAAGCTQITARWNAVINSLAYFLDVSTSNIFASFVPGYNNLNVGNVTTFVVTGLLPGTTYYYRVRSSNACGSSGNSATVTYATLPATPAVPGPIGGPTSVCPATVGINYSVTNVSGVSYTWTVPAGWSITSGAGSNSINVTSGGFGQDGLVSVTAGNSCGTSAPQTLALTIKPVPTVSAVPGSQTVCSGVAISAITISNPNGVAGTTFGWTRDNTANLTGMPVNGTGATINGTLNNGTAALQTSIFSIYAQAAGCSTFTNVPVDVRPLPVANAGINQTICSASSAVIGGSPAASGGTGPYGYAWTPASGLSATNVANPVATPISFPQTYNLVVTDNFGCMSPISSVTLSSGSSVKNWIGTGTGSGGPDNNFNNPANWSPPGVPGPCNDVNMNISIVSIFSLGTTVTVPLTANATIKSLNLTVGGVSALSLGAVFKLDVNSRSLNILNATTINSNAQAVFSVPARTYLSVSNNGVLTYGGNLSTTASNGCTNFPFNANVNNEGTIYVNANATLAAVGNDNTTRPAALIFDGPGEQSITNNNGPQTIYLGGLVTRVGQLNSPVVNMGGSGTNGFRNMGDLEINNNATLDIGNTQLFNRNSAGGTISIAGGARLILQREIGGTSGSNFPSNYSSYNFATTSTVEYNYTGAATQVVYAPPLYGNLEVSKSGSKRAGNPLTVLGNFTINSPATFLANGSTGWTHSVAGNFTNNGTFSYIGGTTNVFNFNGNTNATISGTSSTSFYSVSVSKGTNINTSLTVLSPVTTANSASLTFNSGLLKIDPSGSFIHNGAGPTITASSGLHVNGGTFNVTDATLTNQGLMRITSGNVNIGTIAGNSLNHNSGGVFDMQGGLMNIAGRMTFSTGATATSSISGGMINLVTVGNSSITPSLDMTAATKINVSGGTITLRRMNMGTGGDINILNNPGNKLFSGGLIQVGTSLSPAAQLYKINTAVGIYDFTVDANNSPQAQLTSNIPGSHNITIAGGTLDAATNNRDIFLTGNWVNNSTFLPGTATVTFNGNGNSIISGTAVNSPFYNLTNANTSGGPLEVDMNISVTKKLSLANGARMHLDAGNVSLLSSSTVTAEVDKIFTNDAITYNNGRFVVERYIHTGTAAGQHSKAWQLLAVPTAGSQTVKQAWQEGALTPNANPVPGYGTQITGSVANATTPAIGFDVFTAPGSTMKTYNALNARWDDIPNTTSLPVTNPKGYMVLVRGDRSVTLYNQSAVPTKLRTTGKLYTPGADAPPTVNVPANFFETVSNPYASAIDFRSAGITRSNLGDVFYLWDPQLTSIGPNSAYGLGGFQTFTIGAGGNYYVTPGGGSYGVGGSIHNFIESGQAFMVVAGASNGSIAFDENCKISGSNLVSRAARNSEMQIRTNLYVNLNGNPIIIDGILNQFHNTWQNEVDINDAPKAGNMGENFSILSSGKTLVVEKRKPVHPGDSIQFNMAGLRRQQYMFEFLPNAFRGNALEAFLEDRHLGYLTPVSLTGPTTVSFTVDDIPSSYAANRFKLVFLNRQVDYVKNMSVKTEGISVYPNPARGEVNVEVKRMEEVRSLALIDGNGRPIPVQVQKAGKPGIFKLVFPASLASGQYWIICRREGGEIFKSPVIVNR